MIGLLLLGFVILLLLGSPIVVAMGLPAIIYFIYKDISLSIVSYSFYQSLFSFGMVAIPMFILMGSMVTEFGETERAFRFARAITKGKRGYSAKIGVVLNLIFAGMSGAALSAVVGLGPMITEEMESEGYDKGYAAALSIASSTVGPIFPPSIPLVLYATVASLSSTDCLLAGMLPGILFSACLLIWLSFTHKNHFVKEAKETAEDDVPIKKLFWDAFPIMLAPVLIIITMLGGVFSPGETGAMATLYVLAVTVIHRTFSLKKLIDGLISTAKTCGSILILTVAGALFTKALMLEHLPEAVLGMMGGFVDHPYIVLIIINIILLIMGMFMESNSALLLAAPIILAVTNALGLDPIHIGVVIVMNLMIGLSTPPFGLSLYAVSKAANVPTESVIKNVVPLYIPMLVCLIIVTFVPWLSTFIPEVVFPHIIG